MRFVLALCVCTAAVALMRGDAPPAPARPGALGGGVTLLPNGWKIAPAGRHIQVGDLPLAMLESPDGQSLLVASNGYLPPALEVVDLQNAYVRERLVLDHAWLGLAWHPDGTRLYASGAGNSTVHEVAFESGRLTRGVDIALGRTMERTAGSYEPPPQSFVGGLAITPDGSRLFAVHVLGRVLSAVDLATGHVLRSIDLPAEPYTCVVSRDGTTVFVSLWGGAKVLLFDARTYEPLGHVAVGEHPNAMALSKDGKRLFVACANTNAVWVIDVSARRAVEQISVALFPDAPPGSTPNHVSLSPDDRRLLVANADNNAVAVVDVEHPLKAHVDGFIPTGWYPTAAMFSRDGSKIFILSGKGLTSAANPRFRRGLPRTDPQFIGALLTGTVSVIPTPTPATLQALTKTVYAVTPYSDEHRLAPASAPGASPIPRRVGAPSPITHVFYVIRENRSYDQIFGDLERGNGDPTLTLFGEEVTPNAHALAREFGVLDNFYVDAEVSYDGHSFSTAAYATDFIEKLWPTNYAGRGVEYLAEGGGPMRNAYGNVTAPMNGYIWDACVRANVSVRSYGEFARWGDGTDEERFAGRVPAVASVPGLAGRVSPTYPPWEPRIPDSRRFDAWRREFQDLDRAGRVPALSIVRLPNDHTQGTRPGAPTPRAMIADNDLAVGRLVETISTSRIWTQSAIFIVEDDAQNGPDHVDAHRSLALAISPFSRRRVVDSTLYTTSSILRTIELVLGLPPMSQYDAAATPLYNAFQATPVAAPFTHVPARIPLDEKNERTAWGADESLRMNLAEADRVPDDLLTAILWHAVKGGSTPLPPIVHASWVHVPTGRTGDDDDH